MPQVYLRNFTNDKSKVLPYRTLVPHCDVRLWTAYATKGTGYKHNIYSYTTSEGLTDEMERWFAKEFEAPAGPVIQKVMREEQCTSEDWHHLIRFAAASDVRTPVRMLEDISRRNKTLHSHLQTSLKNSLEKFSSLSKEEKSAITLSKKDNLFPAQVTTKIEKGERMGQISLEVLNGRKLWLHSVKNKLTTTVEALLQYKWTILRPAKGLTWFTSDCPVIRLNYYKNNRYDFKGGWGNRGSEILFPISPNHLMYTKIGDRNPPLKGTVSSIWFTERVRRMIAENAYRHIFSSKIEPQITELRPRVVNREVFESEAEYWRNWHRQNNEAEAEYL